uniref:Uncharacterized protein n=1 Tax=Magallana gigas TaxID=29159 RepID=K1QE23_MAGGI
MQVLARHFRFRSSGKCPTDGHHAEKTVLGILEVPIVPAFLSTESGRDSHQVDRRTYDVRAPSVQALLAGPRVRTDKSIVRIPRADLPVARGLHRAGIRHSQKCENRKIYIDRLDERMR